MSIDGNWNLTMKTPMGVKEGTMELTTDGNNLTGLLHMPAPISTMELIDGKVDGNTLTFSAKVSVMPVKIEVTATVEGDNLVGEAKMGFMGKSTISGVRA